MSVPPAFPDRAEAPPHNSASKPKLLDRVRTIMRVHPYSIRTEGCVAPSAVSSRPRSADCMARRSGNTSFRPEAYPRILAPESSVGITCMRLCSSAQSRQPRRRPESRNPPPTPCVIALQPICSDQAPISRPFRNYSAMKACRPPRSTLMY